MDYNDRTILSPFNTTRSRSPAGSYLLSNTDRRRRFDARADRRFGNWSILEISAPLLWLESEPGWCLEDEFVFAPPVIIDLWP